MHRWCLLNLTVQGFSLNLTVRGVSNKHCLFIFHFSYFIRFGLKDIVMTSLGHMMFIGGYEN